MKKVLLLLSLLLPLMASAMKIEKDEIDEFTGKRTLTTSWEGICKNNIHIRFRAQNDYLFLDFKMHYDGAIVIGQGDQLLFKSTSDEIGKFSSIAIYHGERGAGATGFAGSLHWGISAVYSGDLSYFADNVTRLIRIYTTDVYIDKNINDSDGKKLQKLYALFSNSLTGDSTNTVNYANYTITYLTSSNGGKTWEEAHSEYIKDATPEDIKAKMETWKAKSSGNTLYDCKVKKDK